MAFGERIRKFRRDIGMTQQELGTILGFSSKTATIRIGQYENEKRKPKQDTIKTMAQVFDVAPEAIDVPEIDTFHGVMHTLFALEDRYGLTITLLDGEICLKQDINHPNYSGGLSDDLMAWYKVKDKLTSGSIPAMAYDHWRYSYPHVKIEDTKKELEEMRRKLKEEGRL